MIRRLLTLIFCMLLSASALAQYGPNSQSGVKLRGRSFAELFAAQKILLSNYCRLDFEGTRLQPDGWNRFKPYSSIRTNPEYTRVVVVTRFDIEMQETPSENVAANYQAVGYYEESAGYTAASFSDRVTFRVQEQSGNLLVTDMTPASPHVSPRAALTWINKRLSDPTTSDLERAHLKDALNHLNKFLPQPRPTTSTPGA